METTKNITALLELIGKLPDAKHHIHICPIDGAHCVTNEWLVGGFAGRSFEGDSYESATSELIDYLHHEKEHDTMVGKIIRDSGFPNLEDVYDYCQRTL